MTGVVETNTTRGDGSVEEADGVVWKGTNVLKEALNKRDCCINKPSGKGRMPVKDISSEWIQAITVNIKGQKVRNGG